MNGSFRLIQEAVDANLMDQETADASREGLIPIGSFIVLNIGHDDWCPTLEDRSLASCTCEPFGTVYNMASGAVWSNVGHGWHRIDDQSG
jgi:hypothetical protein